MNNNVNFELLYKQLLEENNQLKKENNQLKGEVKWLKDTEDGELYQDNIFYTLSVVLKMKLDNKTVNPLQWSSKYYQMLLGESYAGIEVKYDTKSIIDNKKMGNVFIATLENDYKKKTGILQTNCKHYVIGNDYFAYIFKVEDLRKVYEGVKKYEAAGKKKLGCRLYRNNGTEGVIIEAEHLNRIAKDYRVLRKGLEDYTCVMIPVYKPYLYKDKVYPVNAYKDDKQAEIECRRIEQAYRGIKDIIER